MKTLIAQLACIFLITSLAMNSCKEDIGTTPLEHSTTKPGVVSNVSVENLKGKAVITYSLPEDKDLLYVKAIYTLPTTGKQVEVKSSFYNNNLMVDGFLDSQDYQVTLYAVNRSEIESDPVEVTVHPKESPIWDVRRSLTVSANFGGFNISAQNPTQSDVVIVLLAKDSISGDWVISDNSVYTSASKILSQIRGLDTLRYNYALTVRDRWQNYTDTLYATVKPLYETIIPKSGYKGIHLPGDAQWNTKTTMDGMWDDNTFDWPHVYQTRADYTPTEPHVITVDIGEIAKISRVKIWDYPEYYSQGRTYYTIGCMKHFEIWGSDNPPSDGSFDNWVLMGTFTETKPSGLPYNEQNDEDYNAAYAGFDWSVDIDAPRVRYLRIKCLQNWGGSTYLAIAELQVYGDPR
ncbi:MAG TPA: DUF5000 domain-containing lipoprotein [Sunxiuqinia sp.]|nr:DUF5000 domain-containing lipoprotein [Sunxiuqinia sp.]